MCGIAGIFAYHADAPPVDGEELHRIREAMARRGPDGAGTWIAPGGRLGLAHRRLAIQDLSEAGAQPMHSPDGRLSITFNGEIYNFRELRAGLEARGHRFRSQSDTEVILALYREKGADLVHELRGMFAFALWDAGRGRLLLARDPFGIKPLYFADDGKSFRFASQVKALLAGGAVDAAPDPAGLAGFYLWGCVPEPFTAHRALRALPAGCVLEVDGKGPADSHPYFNLTRVLQEAEAEAREIPAEAGRERLREALQDSVRHHLVSDVPVALFLSAGIDSSTLAALARQGGLQDLRSITLGFREFQGRPEDEGPLAEATAALLGTRHETRWVSQADFTANLDRALAAMDQPSIDGINTYFVSKAAAEAGVKVAMSGLGGDELFGGYPSFRQVPRLARGLALAGAFPALGRTLRTLLYPLLDRDTSPKWAGLLEYGGSVAGAYLLRRALFMPWELPGLVGEDMAREGLAQLRPLERLEATVQGLRTDRARLSALELAWYMRHQLLRDADWAGMAFGLEIRVPLVDATLFRRIAPLLVAPAPPGKAELAACAEPPLPEAVLRRPKTGFVVPVHQWSQDPAITGIPRRGLRAWALRVTGISKGRPPRPSPRPRRRILVLATDAFGGHGGIAQYNRDLLESLCEHPEMAEVVAVTRGMPKPPEPLPPGLRWVTTGLLGKLPFIAAVLREVWADPGFHLLVCAHVNLLPLARVLQIWIRSPLALFVYGIDVWQPTGNLDADLMTRHADALASISEVTARRMYAWSRADPGRLHLLPNAIHLEQYRQDAKPAYLVERYGLEGRRVLLTLGRMASLERYKGFDEILDALPALLEEFPDLVYLAAGEGSDRGRLEAKARGLGLGGRVIFTGMVPEAEKSDHYRLADAYAMPSRGEGFGFVFLEAMACGVPVVASAVDGSREAVLDGELGLLVDPNDPTDVRRGIREALRRPHGIPPGLAHFAFPNFQARVHALVDGLTGGRP